jgi:DNA-binding MarR family transcriptional regulator
MVWVGNFRVTALVELVLEQLRILPNDVDDLSGTLAGHLKLNRTDLRALEVLRQSDGVTAGELARSLRVTSGATTRVIDSLVEAGHVQREPDQRDRRRTVVRITPKAERAFARALARLQDDWIRVLATYRDDEIQVVLRFVSDYRRLVRAHSRRLSRTIDS